MMITVDIDRKNKNIAMWQNGDLIDIDFNAECYLDAFLDALKDSDEEVYTRLCWGEI